MCRLLFASLVVLLALGSATPAATAAPRSPDLDFVAARTADLATDGERFAIFEPFDGGRRLRDRLEVLDTATGARRRLAKEPDCVLDSESSSGAPTPAGQALLQCDGTGSDRAVLLDLRGRGGRELPATVSRAGGTAEVRWSRVGRQWVAGYARDGSTLAFFNWRSGELRAVPHGGGGRDLDDPALGIERYCSAFDAWQPRSDDAVYDAPYFLTGSRPASAFDQIVLRDCGGGRRPLDRSGAAHQEVRLSAGLATWARFDTRTVLAYDVRARRRFSWVVPKIRAVTDQAARILPTRRFAFIAVTLRESCDKVCSPTQARIYRARVRR